MVDPEPVACGPDLSTAHSGVNTLSESWGHESLPYGGSGSMRESRTNFFIFHFLKGENINDVSNLSRGLLFAPADE